MKKLIGLLICLTLALACAQGTAETDIAALTDANMMVNVHDVYAFRTQKVTLYTPTGEMELEYLAHSEYDDERGVLYAFIYDNGDLEVYGRGEGYGYVADSDIAYIVGYVGGAYEEEMIYYGTQNLGEFEPGQNIVSEEMTPDGKLNITVEGIIGADSYYSYYEGMTLVANYTVNPDNLIIEASEAYARGEDGSKIMLITTTVSFDSTLAGLYDFSVISPSETMREVHVISDPSTDNEFDNVFEVPVNMALSVYVPMGYELFSDEACTVALGATERDEQGNYPMTQTIYAAPAQE